MKISIITVVLNNARHIGSCLQSVLSQTYPDIEHIIIDGGSTDGTLEIIEHWQEVASHWRLSSVSRDSSPMTRVVSEPDNGIYDAMNKGIRMATGDVIGFLHADDFYVDEWIIETVISNLIMNGTDSCYGDLEYVKEQVKSCGEILHGQPAQDPGQKTDRGSRTIGEKKGESQCSGIDERFTVVRNWRSGDYFPYLLKQGWMPPHPTFFVKRSVYQQHGLFDTSFTIAADYELMLRFLGKHEISTCYIPEVLVRMRVGGTSNRNLPNILKKSSEDLRALRMHRIGGLTTLLRKNLSKIPQFFQKQ